MNNYSISVYTPKKNVSDIPFIIVPRFESFDEAREELVKSDCLAFNNDDMGEYFMRTVDIMSIYGKKLSVHAHKKDAKKTEIGLASGILLNVGLIRKDKANIDDIVPFDFDNPYDQKLFSCIFGDDGYVNTEDDYVLYLNRVYVFDPYKGKGFGDYLFSSMYDVVTRFFGYPLDKVYVPLIPTMVESEIKGKTQEEVFSTYGKYLSAMKDILDNHGYSRVEDGTNDGAYLFAKTITE